MSADPKRPLRKYWATPFRNCLCACAASSVHLGTLDVFFVVDSFLVYAFVLKFMFGAD